jgi:putative ABC transport system permease protein
MFELAYRLIRHQPFRYLAALLGVSAAAGLAFIQLGLYFGFKESASVVVDNLDGHLWICSNNFEKFDFPPLLNENVLERVRETPGIVQAEPLLITYADWKLPDGRTESVQVIGFNPESGIGRPWRLVGGFVEDLVQPGAVTVDTSAMRKLNRPQLNHLAEISGISAQVVALTGDIRTFQGHPIVFASIENARSFGRGRLGQSDIHYVVAKTAPDADVRALIEQLQTIPYTNAWTRDEFSLKAQKYWLDATSAGVILTMSALLGLLVGIVVAGQVLYTATLEHLREYGTLKAIGATNRQVGSAVAAQALIGAFPAHLLAGAMLLPARHFISGRGIHIAVDLQTYLLLGICTVLVCLAASMLSVWRILRVDPADVFRGG